MIRGRRDFRRAVRCADGLLAIVGVCIVGVCIVGVCIVGVCVVGVCVVGVCVVAFAARPAPDRADLRTWTDHTGRYRTEAAFVELRDGRVLLEKRDGATIVVSLENLSSADRQYVRTRKAASGARTAVRGITSASDALDPWPLSGDWHASYVGSRDGPIELDEATRTEARESSTVNTQPRTIARSTARTVGRTNVRVPDDRGARQVVVVGFGTTPEQALQDCFRKAVENIAGTIVNAESRIENDRLVMERILTFSDGYIEAYEELEDARVENGLIRRRICATVRRDRLMVACGRAESMSIGVNGLYPEAMTQLERKRNAQALLRATLDLIPSRLIDLQCKRKPTVAAPADTRTGIDVELTIRINASRCAAVQDRLIQIFRCLTEHKGTVSATTRTLPAAWQPAAKDRMKREFLSGPSASAGGFTAFAAGSSREPSPQAESFSVLDADFGTIRALVMERVDALSPPAPHFAFSLYPKRKQRPQPRMPEGPVGTIVQLSEGPNWRWFILADRLALPPSGMTIDLRLCDEDGQEIATTALPLGPWAPGLGANHQQLGDAPQTVFVSPFFLHYSGVGYHIPYITIARSLTVHGQITLPNDVLARVKTIDVVAR